MDYMINGALIEVEDEKEKQEKEKKILGEYYERFRRKNEEKKESTNK